MAGFLIVDAFGASLSSVKRVILSESYSEKPRQQWRGFLFLEMDSPNKSGPTRRTVRPLSVRTAGGIRTRDLHFRRKAALSAELQRYAK